MRLRNNCYRTCSRLERAAGITRAVCSRLPLTLVLSKADWLRTDCPSCPTGTDLRGRGFEESEYQLPGEEVPQHGAEVLAQRLDRHNLAHGNAAEDAFQQVLLRVEKGHQCCRRGPGRRKHPTFFTMHPSMTASMLTVQTLQKNLSLFPKTI